MSQPCTFGRHHLDYPGARMDDPADISGHIVYQKLHSDHKSVGDKVTSERRLTLLMPKPGTNMVAVTVGEGVTFRTASQNGQQTGQQIVDGFLRERSETIHLVDCLKPNMIADIEERLTKVRQAETRK